MRFLPDHHVKDPRWRQSTSVENLRHPSAIRGTRYRRSVIRVTAAADPPGIGPTARHVITGISHRIEWDDAPIYAVARLPSDTSVALIG